MPQFSCRQIGLLKKRRLAVHEVKIEHGSITPPGAEILSLFNVLIDF